MRDPDGAIEFTSDRVIRLLRTPLTDSHFLHSATAQSWLRERRLVAFELIDEVTPYKHRASRSLRIPRSGVTRNCTTLPS